VAQRLGADAELSRHETDRAVALAVLGGRLRDQPDGSFLQLRGIPPLDRAGREVFCHGSIFLQGRKSLH
jgi:hypothetical protein